MRHTPTSSDQVFGAAGSHGRATGRRRMPRPQERRRGDFGRRGFLLWAPVRWLSRKLSGLARWAAARLRAPLRPVARVLALHWATTHAPAPMRWVARLFLPGRERGFGFWWLIGTLAVAAVLGVTVALLLTPLAGLIALLVVAIWSLARWRRRPGSEDRWDDGSEVPVTSATRAGPAYSSGAASAQAPCGAPAHRFRASAG